MLRLCYLDLHAKSSLRLRGRSYSGAGGWAGLMPEDAGFGQLGSQSAALGQDTARVPSAAWHARIASCRRLAHLSAAMRAKGRRPGGPDAWRSWYSGSRDSRPAAGSRPGHRPRPAPRLSWSILLCGLVCRHLTKRGVSIYLRRGIDAC